MAAIERAAALAPLVDEAADNGDSIALQIINDAATQLATLAGSVRGQLWPERAEVDVAYVGGVFESQRLRERFRLLGRTRGGRAVCGAVAGTGGGRIA